MSPSLRAVLAAALALTAAPAAAHRVDEVLRATLLTIDRDRIDGTLRIVPGAATAPASIASIDRDADGAFSDDEQAAYAKAVVDDLSVAIDGAAARPSVVAWRFPSLASMRDGLGEIVVDFAVAPLPGPGEHTVVLTNRRRIGPTVDLANVVVPRDPAVRIDGQRRSADQSVYAINYRRAASGDGARDATVDGRGPGVDARPWRDLFAVGMRHIANGADHLMFLLVLLLPAPLVRAGSRWGGPVAPRCALAKTLAIVTAFTIGHSLTLALSAIGGLELGGRATEVLVAVSILTSAVHAWRPLFAGREPYVAAAFGLVHGLAFAQVLDRLGVERWDRVAGTLAFNVGIEAMQLIVVAAVLPSLLLLGRTAAYAPLRIAGAGFAALASIGWIVERLFDVRTPVDAIVDAIVDGGGHRAAWLAASLFASALATTWWRGRWCLGEAAPALRTDPAPGRRT